MKTFLASAFVALLFFASSAHGAGHVVLQADHTFSQLFLKAENNEVVTFRNQGDVAHELLFTFKGGKQTLVKLVPGMVQGVEFNRFGVYDVRCSVHPKMHMTVFVPYVMKVGLGVNKRKARDAAG